jgi:hypothetical protein
MFVFPTNMIHRLVRLSFILVLLQLGACGLNLGGPQSTAVKYVRNLVEQPDNSPELVKAYSMLPNHVVIAYARALHKQGVKQKYTAEKLGATADSKERIAVSIIPVRKNYVVQERDHTLVLIMENSKNQGWQVIDIKAEP